MTPKEKAGINQYKAGSLPNFERLTALLNRQKTPKRALQTVILLGKPLLHSSDQRLQEP